MTLGVTLAAHATVSAVSGASLAYAAWVVLRRRNGGKNDGAHMLLALFWATLSVLSLVTGLAVLGVALGGPIASFGTATLALSALLIPLSLWALTAHASYLARGSHDLALALGVFYSALAAVFLAVVGWLGPIALATDAAGIRVTFPNPLPPGVTAGIVFVSVAPLFAMAIAYLSLTRRMDGHAAQRRGQLLGAALALWALRGIVTNATMQGAAMDTGVHVAATLGFGLAPPLLVLLAYRQEKANEKMRLGTPI